jgi:serine/threonine-protein kinase
MELYLKRSPQAGGFHFVIDDVIVAESERRYELGDRLGCGGNAVVHACVDVGSADEFAVKFQVSHQGARLNRFGRERELLLAAQHPHLIRCLDFGSAVARSYAADWQNGRAMPRLVKDGVGIPFLVMERAETTLWREINDGTVVLPESYTAQFRGLAQALGVLHDHAVHRDIKPSNILIIGDRWVLSDFGLCSFHDPDQTPLTQNFERIGPQDWMSPEAENRASGGNDEITTASDVYQLGMVFWFVVMGHKPTGQIERAGWKGPERLFDPIAAALSVDPRARPQTGHDLLESLETVLLT